MRGVGNVVRAAACVAVVAVLGASAPAHAALAAGSYKVDPTTVVYGNVTIGRSVLEATKITNTGSQDLRFGDGGVPSPFAVVPGGGAQVESPCVFRDSSFTTTAVLVAPGDSCYMYYDFSPTAAGAKSVTAKITVTARTHDAPDATASVTLKGTGVTPKFTVQPTTVAFGNVTLGRSSTQDVFITNTSDVYERFLPGPLSAASRFKALPAGSYPNPCWRTDNQGVRQAALVAPGQYCVMRYAFDAVKTGAVSATNVISMYQTPDPNIFDPATELPAGAKATATKTVTLKAAGVLPSFSIDPKKTSFTSVTVGRQVRLDLTVRNTSDVYERFLPAAFPSTSAFFADPQSSTCWRVDNNGVRLAQIVAPGSSCTVAVYFTPAKTGSYSATNVISMYQTPDPTVFNPATELPAGSKATKTATAQFTGKGVAPTFTVAPKAIDFGKVTLGGQRITEVTFTNSSDVYERYLPTPPSSSSPFTAVAGSGALDGTCWRTDGQGVRQAVIIASGHSCTMQFAYTPQAAGSANTTVKVSMYTSPDPSPFNDSTELPAGSTAVGKASVTLKGVAVKPTGKVSPATLPFLSVPATTERTLSVTLTNTSDEDQAFAPPLTVAATAAFRPRDEPKEVPGRCWSRSPDSIRYGRVLSPGGSCTMRFTFTPNAAGAKSGQILIGMYPGGPFPQVPIQGTPNATVKLALTGTGTAAPVPAPAFTVAPTPLDVGSADVGSFTEGSVDVTNTSGVWLRFFPRAFPNGSPFSAPTFPTSTPESPCWHRYFDGTDSAYFVAPGQTCTMTYRFTPQKNGPVSVSHTIAAYATGPGDPAPDLEEGPGAIAAATRTFVLTGTGGVN